MDEIRWGIMGAARFAQDLMGPALATAPGGHLAALATRDPAKAVGFRTFAPGLRVHDSYDALLDDPQIDAIYIPLPNHMHLEWTLKAAAAGKHVLCEKPMVMAEAEFDRLIGARDAARVLVAEAFMVVFHPQWRQARDLLAEGALGHLWRIDGAFAFNNRDMTDIRNRAETGGGGLRDIGVYTMGTTRFATGLEPTDLAATAVWEDGVDVYARVTARFGTADYSTCTCIRAAPRQEMTFHGETGVLRLPVPFNPRVFGEARLELTRGGETTIHRFPREDQYVLQVTAFNRSVREGVPYECPLEFSRGTQAMIDAALARSAAPLA